jgi:hypothetical protein
VLLHRKKDRGNEQSEALSFAKLDRLNSLNKMSFIIRMGYFKSAD